MEFGIFDQFENKPGESIVELFQNHFRLAELAEAVGAYCFHVSEHHFTPLCNSPSPHLILAAVAERTSTIKLGPLGALLPFYEPLRVIEEICMLDNMSNGRLEYGLGRGTSTLEQKLYNIEFEQSRAMFNEALDIINLGLTSPRLDFSGEYWDYDNIPMEMHPIQDPVPMWYPTSNVNSVPWVAESGYHTLFAGELDKVADQVRTYKEKVDPALLASRKIGLGALFVSVAPSDSEAMEVGSEAYLMHHHNLAYLREWSGRRGSMTRQQNLKAPATLPEAVETGWAVAGAPDTIVPRLQEIINRTGVNYVLYNPMAGSPNIDYARRAVELFATKVMPLLEPAGE